MLVISRKRNEGILIRTRDGEIRIVLAEIEKGRIRLGIEAPKGCTIFREELVHEVEQINRLSAIKTIEDVKGIIEHEG